MLKNTKEEAKTRLCILLTKIYGKHTLCLAEECMCWVDDIIDKREIGECKLYEKPYTIL